jgi:hypothetical protein
MKNELRMNPKAKLPIALWLVEEGKVRVARGRANLKPSTNHSCPTSFCTEGKAPNRFAAWLHAPAIP